ncbi:MAG: cytochrome c oxidase accessory protein CcoG [Planctomycetota bacterium]
MNTTPTDSTSPARVTLPTASAAVPGCGSDCGGKCGNHAAATKPAMLRPEEHVLSTLEADGSRRWLRPSLSTGSLWRKRRFVAYVLIAVFVAIPHLRLNGKPLVMLDITAREFTILGHTFLPTDTPLLALGMIGVFVSIAAITAVGGRLWCGWACPQTVYMEFLFRPIDRWFEGTVGRGGKAKRDPPPWMKVLRIGIYLVLSMLLAHTFLAYFVGTERLSQWIQSSPTQHPMAFLVMAGTTVAMLFDFLFFREQLCLIACPYGRFQSVMLDRRSLIVGYDQKRGEPRGKKSKNADRAAKGDCVDCKRCVAVCPTGIDIRDGLQMECINCTQCIDACNEVMAKIGREPNLITFTSQDQLEGKPGGLLRARTILYPIVLAVVLGVFLVVLSTKYAFDARALRAAGNPYTRLAPGVLQNSLRLRLVNRSDEQQSYDVNIREPREVTLEILDKTGLTLESGKTAIVPIALRFPHHLTASTGSAEVIVNIEDTAGNVRELEYRVLGPRR